MLNDRSEAFELLSSLKAPDRLIQHASFVVGAANMLLTELQCLGVPCDARVVELGAILHDAGKILHPEELSMPGSLHEQAGEALLLAQGVQPEVARCAASHRDWNRPEITFEERIVSLADKLWKGKRDPDLELIVIDDSAAKLHLSRWEIFERLDSAFEEIASHGANRLQESRHEQGLS